MDKTKFKKLTRDVVSVAFTWLLVTNKKATSLEVKNVLRNIGYWATQRDVSAFLISIYKEYADWNITIETEDGKSFVQQKNVFTPGTAPHVEYFLSVLVDDEDEDECDGCGMCECDDEEDEPDTDTVTTAAPVVPLKDAIVAVIRSYNNLSSAQIAQILNARGYATTANQVRAYKANLNR
jgi:hypothetical protein